MRESERNNLDDYVFEQLNKNSIDHMPIKRVKFI